MTRRCVRCYLAVFVLSQASVGAYAAPPRGTLPDNDTVMKALVEELGRSMDGLSLGDLPKPYFIQYNAEDRLTFSMSAAYGSLQRSNANRFRTANSRVRVGSFDLDNSNTGRGIGGRTTLPIDDDLGALRHEVWKMTDGDYKRALETLARKIAYLRQKNVEDRPADFTPEAAVVAIEPSAEIAFDNDLWKENLKRLSARFKQYPEIQDSEVNFFAGAVNSWVVNSEGTRVRRADTGVYIECRAETQAEDGMRLSDRKSYLGLDIGGIPPVEKMLSDIDTLCKDLIALSHAPVLEHYSGPVLFEPRAAGQVFDSLMADKLCARPVPLGSNGGDPSFEKKIGRRVLPKSFQVYDDPSSTTFEDTVLAGAYTFDDEGMRPQRVELVRDGMLRTLVSGRAPTKKIKQSNGHARTAGFGDPEANVGCLYIADAKGMSPEELKTKLIEAAQDEGLDYGLRVASLEPGGYGALGNPVDFFKVYVEDGREERIRGMEFAPVEVNAMKRLLAGGKKREVFNKSIGISESIISPAILFDELELNKIEREFDKRPILKPPALRTDS